MEFSHLFYKDISLDEDNIFSTNITENNEVEQISFKKLKLYGVSGLLIDQDISPTFLYQTNKKKKLSAIF